MDSAQALSLVLAGVACFVLGVVLATIYWKRRMAAEVQVAKNDTAYWRSMAEAQRGAEMVSTFDIFSSPTPSPAKSRAIQEH